MMRGMQEENSPTGIVHRLSRRLRGWRSSPNAEGKTGPASAASSRNAGTSESQRAQITQLRSELAAVDREREELKAQRLHLQEVLGAQHGKRVLPRLKVEKTNGVPSLVVGARMMQRVHAKADDPLVGLDGAGSIFGDREQTEAFMRSHGVQLSLDFAGEPTAVVHAFKGKTPLIELRREGRVKHVTPRGDDLGDIRAGAEYDPEIVAPDWLGVAVRATSTLSTHISRPYVQFGWRESDEGPLLAQVDVSPERVPVLSDEWDQRLGKAFDRAHARMLMQPYRIGALDNRVPGGTFSYEETV